MSDGRDALKSAVSVAGGQTAFAALLSAEAGRAITQQHVFNWLNRGGVLPAEMALPAEAAMRGFKGRFSRSDFRPDLYPAEREAA
jgi:DNA-binding transcriptional regulator YdaS (Cro superfamily)